MDQWSMVHLRLDPSSGVPLGLQIERQLRLAIATGRLAPGERLPPARELAGDLAVNFHTVRKAYGSLERKGLLSVERGRGTSVPLEVAGLTKAELRREVRERLARLLEELAGADLTAGELRRIVGEELAKLTGGGR